MSINVPFSMRNAKPADSGFLLRLRNHADTKKYSLNSHPIAAHTHNKWFSEKLKDRRTSIFIIEDRGRRPFGQIRIDRKRNRWGEVSLAITPGAKGRGVGTEALKKTVSRLKKLRTLRGLAARIITDNVASTLAFLKAGFMFRKIQKIHGKTCYRLEFPFKVGKI